IRRSSRKRSRCTSNNDVGAALEFLRLTPRVHRAPDLVRGRCSFARTFELVIPAKAGIQCLCSCRLSLLVIPAQAGIQLYPSCARKKQSFHSACGRAGYFLCLCKESNQRNTLQVARSPGILPSECASALRGSLSAHPCARSELARILRAILTDFPSRA